MNQLLDKGGDGIITEAKTHFYSPFFFISTQNPTNNQRRWRLCLDSPDHEAIQGLLAEGIQKKGLPY